MSPGTQAGTVTLGKDLGVQDQVSILYWYNSRLQPQLLP